MATGVRPGHPEPFDLDLDIFLAGQGLRELDIDLIFAKPFERLFDEMREYAANDIIWDAGQPAIPSLLVPGAAFREVPAGIILVDGGGAPIGGYLSCDLSLEESWRGKGLGAELVIERCLRDGEVPTWNLDEAAYSPAGLAAHRAAWRHVRSHPEQTAIRTARLRGTGYPV